MPLAARRSRDGPTRRWSLSLCRRRALASHHPGAFFGVVPWVVGSADSRFTGDRVARKSTPMGRFAKVITSERRTNDFGAEVVEITADLGGNDAHACELYQPSGDDALPLPGDFVEVEEGVESGTWVVVGVHDPRNRGKALPGEKRFYIRDEDNNLIGEFYGSREEITVEGFEGLPIRLKTSGPVILESPDVRLSDSAGRAVARIGDLVVVTVGPLVATVPGSPPVVAPVTPGAGAPIAAAGQIISGASKVKA